MRSYKEPRYDSEVILASGPGTEFVLFAKPVGQTLNDGNRKTLLHTNMTQASQLGTPQSFDVYAHNARLLTQNAGTIVTPPTKQVSVGNFNLVYAAGISQVIFGQDSFFLTVPIEDIPSGIDTEGVSVTDFPHIGLGQSENMYRFDIGGRALHINSTETFNVKISFPAGLAGITGNLLFKWYIRGILYKGV